MDQWTREQVAAALTAWGEYRRGRCWTDAGARGFCGRSAIAGNSRSGRGRARAPGSVVAASLGEVVARVDRVVERLDPALVRVLRARYIDEMPDRAARAEWPGEPLSEWRYRQLRERAIATVARLM